MLAPTGRTAHWDPRGLAGLPIDTVLPVWSSHQTSYLRRFIREAASGARLSDPLGAVGVAELEQRGSAGGHWTRPLSLASGAFYVFCFFFDSACLSGLKLCHTASSCCSHLGMGDDDCFGPLLGNGLGNLASLQLARRPRLVWLHNYGVRLHQSGRAAFRCRNELYSTRMGPEGNGLVLLESVLGLPAGRLGVLDVIGKCIAPRLAHCTSRGRSLRVAVTESVLLHIV